MTHIADCSLSLINRTGAHFVAREIVDGLPDRFSRVRHWRFFSRQPPADPWRKVCGRLMLQELLRLGDSSVLPWPMPRGAAGDPVLYMDPLYVLRSRLRSTDLVLCHDVGPVSHPEIFDPETSRMYREAYAKIKATAPAMAFVSQTSRDAFVALYGSAFPRLDVVPLFARRQSVEGAEEPVPGVRTPFLLTVGAFEPRKNHPRSVAAFLRSGLPERGVGYVICGARAQDWEEVVRSARGHPGIHVLPYVSEPQLRWLYRSASAFVLPSLLEGFGMPALEAAQYGLVPVVSTDGALEEATGRLGVSVDPLSVDGIAEGMRLGFEKAGDAELRQRLKDFANGYSRERFLEGWAEVLAGETRRIGRAAPLPGGPAPATSRPEAAAPR